MEPNDLSWWESRQEESDISAQTKMSSNLCVSEEKGAGIKLTPQEGTAEATGSQAVWAVTEAARKMEMEEMMLNDFMILAGDRDSDGCIVYCEGCLLWAIWFCVNSACFYTFFEASFW